ncbi:MAG: 6-bladed beta-propeller [bacterium]|nr:6-bladed beta-propeller [bacterium]
MNPAKTFLLFTLFTSLTLFSVGCAPKQAIKPDLVWPSAPEKPRIKFLRSIQGKSDFTTSKMDAFKKTLAGETSLERVVKPYGLAIDSKGRLLVADAGNRCVLVFDENAKKSGDILTYIGTSGAGQLTEPAGVAVDDEDRVYVTDVRLNAVFVFDAEGNLLRNIKDTVAFQRPAGIAYNKVTQEIIVVDTKAYHAKCFRKDGSFVRTIGTKGSREGEFNLPSNIVCDTDGYIYIVDTMNFRVQVFDKDGKFVSTFGQADNVPGSFSRPRGITVDSDNNIYVADAAFDNIQIFQRDGSLLLYFGAAGKGDGQFQLPAGLCFDQKNRLYVADQYNGRVQVFQYIQYKAETGK